MTALLAVEMASFKKIKSTVNALFIVRAAKYSWVTSTNAQDGLRRTQRKTMNPLEEEDREGRIESR